ncbi:MAG: nitroreductase family protein [Candidatus Thermoplasmatota archaeon]|nr:nitroreductase family protein [Candidatus Thermoplasmatota archaeon]
MDVYDAIVSRRSIRRFQQKPIKLELLKKFVDAARVAPSGANLQVLEYFVVSDKELCSKIFDTIGWAGYIKPTWAPSKEERPTAYVVILVNDIDDKYHVRDIGLATGTIVLAAEAENIGSCILCNIKKDEIQKILRIPDTLHVDSVIALGYKAEQPVVEDIKDSVEYWRDENEVLHVPKRRLKDILHINNF